MCTERGSLCGKSGPEGGNGEGLQWTELQWTSVKRSGLNCTLQTNQSARGLEKSRLIDSFSLTLHFNFLMPYSLCFCFKEKFKFVHAL